MNFQSIPWPIVIFLIVQTAGGVWFIIKMYFKLTALDEKVNKLETENKELKAQLKLLSDTLLLVKNNTDLLLLGRIKTGSKAA
jgi:cell division protein FtsB